MTVAVVGVGDAAVQEAAFLARASARVVLVQDRDRLCVHQALQSRLPANPRITVCPNRVVDSIAGDDRVTDVMLRDTATVNVEAVPVDGVFVCRGHVPNTGLVRGQVVLDPTGYIRTNSQMQTSRSHVYAAGEIRFGAHRQLVTAAADGAVAAMSAARDVGGV
jgi:thioredoxin reductase (NADPH)